MPRVIWKGAISFGLVHVPVALYPASTESGIDFDWLDKRTMDPVGYQRINKRTGKPITAEHIVKGVKVDDGDYVLLSEDEIRTAYPKSTQTIEIEAFVQAPEIPFTHLDRPYYLEPIGKGQKVYALLREAMLARGVIGIARVVMHTKEHLAALVPAGPALVLNTLRWAEEIRPWTEIELPDEGPKAAGLKEAELKMASQLIEDMTQPWDPSRYTDTFSDAIRALIDRRVAAGKTEQVQPLEQAATPASSNVIDLTDLLARSLGQRGGKDKGEADGGAAKAGARTAARAPAASSKTAARKTPARKRA